KARKLYHTFLQDVHEKPWPEQAKKFQSSLTNAASYQSKFGSPLGKLTPPRGTIYHIGIALPKSESNRENYRVVKALYLGALLAADEYNKKHHRAQVAVNFVDIGESPMGMKPAIKHFVRQKRGD